MGIARKASKAWLGVNGTARQFWPNTVALSSLALGSRVKHSGKYYTVVAKNYIASGDVVLWSETGIADTVPIAHTVATTPFGTAYTNGVSINYQYSASSTYADGPGEKTGYGFSIPANALKSGTTSNTTEPFMSYFSSDTQRKRATAYATGDQRYSGNMLYYYYFVKADGSITSSNTTNVANSNANYVYYAYSVKGTIGARKQGDGSYALTI